MPLSKPLAFGLAGLLLASAPAYAAETKAAGQNNTIAIELNNASQQEDVCRLSFLVRNGFDKTLKDIGIEIVLLSQGGLAQDFMMLRTGELSAGKRRVRQFDLPDVACADLGEILINDVSDCQGDGLSAPFCLAALRPSSRISVKLGL